MGVISLAADRRRPTAHCPEFLRKAMAVSIAEKTPVEARQGGPSACGMAWRVRDAAEAYAAGL